MKEIDERLIRAIVLLGRQHLITEHVVKRRKPQVLARFEKAIKESKQSIHDVVRVYELAFSIVDNIVRYQKIASMLPRLSHKSTEFKLFSSRLKGMKKLRNLLQHINRDIDTEFESPILGGISWAKGDLCYTVAFNDLGVTRTIPGLIYDTHEGKFTKEFCYVHNGEYFDLSMAIKGYRDYQKHVEGAIQIITGDSIYKVGEHFLALAMSVSIPNKNRPNAIE